jgi:acetoin utilization protein AcuC
MTVAILYRPELKEYDFGVGHPFRGDRYEHFLPFLKSRLNEDHFYKILAAEPATDDDLLRICDKDYIDFCKEYFHAVHNGWTYFYENFSRYQSADNKPSDMPGNLEEAARLVIGQAKTACDLVQQGEYLKAVSIGGGLHHAKRSRGEGFCIYNDVAFTGMYLVEKYHLERVLILDTDAHAGNGTAEYFYGNPKVLFIDVHQDPRTIYPGTGMVSEIGEDAGQGFTVNVPMPLNAGYDSYKAVFDEIILPLTAEFQPQIIIRNGGSDPHFDDGLTNLGLTIAGFHMIGEKVRQMAEVCQGKLIDLIASGYNPAVLPYGWMSLIAGIAGFPLDIEEPVPVPQKFKKDLALPDTLQVIAEVKNNHRRYWKCMS